MQREKASIPSFLAELEKGRGANGRLDQAIDTLKQELTNDENLPLRARRLTEMMALAWQGSLLVQQAPAAVSDAFCASRLGSRWSGALGTLPVATDLDGIIDRIAPFTG